MKNKIKRCFTQVPNELINNNNLSRDSRFLFVYLCSKPDDWTFHVEVIERDLNCSKDSRIKYMKELVNSGWVTTEQKKKGNGEWGAMEICLNPFPFFEPQPKISDTVQNPTPEKPDTEKIGSGKNPTHNKKEILNNNNLFTNTDEIVPVSIDVLNYLNKVKKSNVPFKATKTNLSDIEKRLKEKFTFSDFKKVIDFKVHEWENEDKMKKYIRPETLFGKKFNAYLVESENEPTKKNDGSENFEYNPTEKADLL